MTVASLGWAWFSRGNIAMATRYAIDGLLESHAMRDLATTTISLHVGVLVAVMTGRFEDAAEVIGAFEASCERYGVRPPAALTTFIKVTDPFGATRKALSPRRTQAAYERGARMSLDEGRSQGRRTRRRRRGWDGASGRRQRLALVPLGALRSPGRTPAHVA